jgi:uncharacterized protein (TIGR02001 family)
MAHRWGPALAGCVALSAAAVADEKTRTDNAFDPFKITVGSSIASDYIYRGVTLSAHRPTVGSTVEITLHDLFYVGGAINSVKLPTSPPAEVVLSGGIRPTFFDKKLELDLGVNYYWYPNEMLNGIAADTDYWEAQLGATYKVVDGLELKGTIAWSPNLSKTGAWSKYSEVGFGYELPESIRPFGLETEISAGIGRYWFGAVMPELGDYRLPAYTYWHAGVEFAFEQFKLDLRYHNTNLSKEDCFVFTGDPNATPGGIVNDANNPDGLRSNWCGAVVVATLKFELEVK